LKRKGGWQTRTTPKRRRIPERHLRMFSLSPRVMTERTMVTTGQAKMMQRASGTGMKLTLARLAMKLMAPARPDEKQFESVCLLILFIIAYLGTE
jgi:hypothetical protein